MTETIAEVVRAHRAGTMSPVATVERTFARIRAHGDPAIFISLRDEADVVAEARRLVDGGRTDLPLYGVPFAVKDNIDVAVCRPPRRARLCLSAGDGRIAVARLRQAGAIIIGKTNLDQFATGLVGVRSPYGVPRNPLDPKLIPGRLEHGVGRRGRDRTCAGRARHRYGGLGPHSGAVQQYCRPQAEPRTRPEAGRGAGMPDARLRVRVRPDGRRCLRRARPHRRSSMRRTRIAAAVRCGPHRPVPPRLRLGAPFPASACSSATGRLAADYSAALDRLA